MRESVLAAFAEKGFYRQRRWRTGGLLWGRISHNLKAGEVVSFLAFHERGLGYPAHWFLHGLLNEWGLELQHLNPTWVLHITGFVTMSRSSLGWSRTWTSSGGYSLGELCRRGSRS